MGQGTVQELQAEIEHQYESGRAGSRSGATAAEELYPRWKDCKIIKKDSDRPVFTALGY